MITPKQQELYDLTKSERILEKYEILEASQRERIEDKKRELEPVLNNNRK